jgi:signal peptidase I
VPPDDQRAVTPVRPPDPAPAQPGEGEDDPPGGDEAVPHGSSRAEIMARRRRAARGRRRWIFEWVAVLLVAAGLALGARAFVVQTFTIPSGSMIPTLQVGDRIVVDKLSYHLHGVHRGDIVVFRRPPGEPDLTVQDLVKRVIGLPGDTIASGPHGEVFIDGKPIAQPWLTASARLDPGPPISPQRLGSDQYFVMGDNRGNSEDSRFFGPISGSLIVGHVVLRMWPLSRIGIL